MFGKKNNNKNLPLEERYSGKKIVSDIVRVAPSGFSENARKAPDAVRPPEKSDGGETKDKVLIRPPDAGRLSFKLSKAGKAFGKNKSRWMSSAAILAASLFLIFVFLRIFASVTVRITPVQEFKDANVSFRAAIKGGEIPVEIMNFRETFEKSAKATGVKDISQKASGVIAVLNAFSSEPQVLVRSTRFESSDGKVYRIDNRVVVPGAKIVNGKVEPSSIEATVYADESGENYNGPPTDFTIPGFKGTPKYEGFFARSKTPLSGGFVGKVNVVLNEDIEPLRSAAKSDLESRLAKRAEQEKPEGFLMPEEAFNIKFISESVNPPLGERADEFSFSSVAGFSGIIVRPGDIESALVKKLIPNESFPSVRVVNLDELLIKMERADFEKGEAVISIVGKAHFVWQFDENKIKNGLLAVPSEEREKVFSSQPSIDRAEIIFRPSWWRLFPSNSEKIKIVEVINE